VKPSPANPRFLGLRTAISHAPDLAKGKSWYSKILAIQPYFDQPFYVGFSVGGYELGLDPDPSSSPPSHLLELFRVSSALHLDL